MKYTEKNKVKLLYLNIKWEFNQEKCHCSFVVDYVVINIIKKTEQFWNKDYGEDLTGF